MKTRLYQSCKHTRGASLAEMLMVVMIIGILAGIGIDSAYKEWTREQVNRIAIDLSGWLETTRRAALRSDGNGCRVIINSGTLITGDTLASASCLQSLPLTINNSNTVRYKIETEPSDLSGTFYFTPRGTVYPYSKDNNAFTITIYLDSNPSLKRCVTVESLLGMIGLGKKIISTDSIPHCDNAQIF